MANVIRKVISLQDAQNAGWTAGTDGPRVTVDPTAYVAPAVGKTPASAIAACGADADERPPWYGARARTPNYRKPRDTDVTEDMDSITWIVGNGNTLLSVLPWDGHADDDLWVRRCCRMAASFTCVFKYLQETLPSVMQELQG